MSTAASIDFSHTHYDITYVQIQNISTITLLLYCMDTSYACTRIFKKNSRVPVTCLDFSEHNVK